MSLANSDPAAVLSPSRSMRYECLQLARRHQAAFIQLYIHCPLDVALQRNAHRAEHSRVPEPVVRRLAAVFEEPDADKHPWEASTIVLDGCKTNTRCVSTVHGVYLMYPLLMQCWFLNPLKGSRGV